MRVAKRTGEGRPGETRIYEPCDGSGAPYGIAVTIRNPTEGEKREAFSASSANGFGDDGWRREIILKHVTKVTGYQTPEGDPIDTAAKLWAHGEHDIVGNIAAEILSGYSLSEASKKNSRISSGSVSQPTHPSAGTAESAAPRAPAGPAAATAHPTTPTLPSSQGSAECS